MDIESKDPSKQRASFDPGWNDPPVFSYDTTKAAGQSGKRGPLLNKRVAFPLGPSSSGKPSTQSSASDAPPLLPPVIPPNMPPSSAIPSGAKEPSASTSPTVIPCGNNEAVEKGVNVLNNILDTLPAEDKREKDEIRKRLDVLRRMCSDNKLNDDIYGRVVQLATALHSGDTSTASNIQAGLMVDHVGLCSSWMSGVRLLVRRLADPDA